MVPKIRNIIIFAVIGTVFILVYMFFIKPKPPVDALVSSAPSSNSVSVVANEGSESLVAQEFLALLYNVKNIKLDDAIFSDDAFNSLRDSSIILIPDGTEGRVNPFAPLGVDVITPLPTPPPTCVLPKVLDVSTNTCVTPPPTCVLPKVLNTSTNTCVNPPLN